VDRQALPNLEDRLLDFDGRVLRDLTLGAFEDAGVVNNWSYSVLLSGNVPPCQKKPMG